MNRATGKSAWWRVAGGILGLLMMVGLLSGAEAAPLGAPGGSGGPRARILTAEDREAITQVIGKRIQEQVGLTSEQWEQVRTILRTSREQARADFRALRQAQREFRALLASPAPDSAAVKGLADQIKALQGALLDRRIETVTALHGALTPEQWERWQTLRRGRPGRGWGRIPDRF